MPWFTAYLAGVPVTPDADTAQRWLVEELARPEYAVRESLLQRLWEWFQGLFGDISGVDTPPWYVIAGAAVIVAIVLLIARWVTGPIRLRGAGRKKGAVIDHDDTRSASTIRASADAAAARGDWAVAVAERFRAIIRSLEERAILDERPGYTAQEAADAISQRLPAHIAGVHRAALLFDGVVYGHQTASQGDDAGLRELDHHLSAARAAALVTADDVTP
jgi:hypothetical protein